MPTWPERCPLHVKVTTSGAGGATSFNFMNGQVWQVMNIEGSLERILSSVLPHEVTHTVFAHHFRMPVPRWADEGGSVLSEDDLERSRHDSMVRQILNSGRAIPLRRLFTLRDYPREVGSLYAEGFSVSNFLVNSSDRPTFLKFVAHGMQYGWDGAAQTYYRYQSVEQLEEAAAGSTLRRDRPADRSGPGAGIRCERRLERESPAIPGDQARLPARLQFESLSVATRTCARGLASPGRASPDATIQFRRAGPGRLVQSRPRIPSRLLPLMAW
jgi:hypothetical protein